MYCFVLFVELTDENQIINSVGHHLELGVDGEDGVEGHEPRLLDTAPAAHNSVVPQKHYLRRCSNDLNS